MPFLILVGGLFLVVGGLWLRSSVQRKRRRAVIEAPFPDAWDVILRENLPPYEKLSVGLREELQTEIKLMLAEKRFEGCGGLVITDEIRVTIAAQAGMLLLNREDMGYPSLRTILVYPSSYVAGGKGLLNKDEPKSVRLGESCGKCQGS